MKFLYQFSVQHYLQSDIRDVPGRPGRPFPNAPGYQMKIVGEKQTELNYPPVSIQ